MNRPARLAAALLPVLALAACALLQPPAEPPIYDLVIKNGTVYDGSGGEGTRADVGIIGDRVVEVGDLALAQSRATLDAGGMAVAPGFINLLSWATESLLVDGRGMADTMQGVTLEVFGEGWSMGPLNAAMKKEMVDQQGDLKYDVDWTTLGEYLDNMVRRGVTPNVASFVGAATVRIHELGYDNRPPNPEELARMKDLVRQGMREGALGVGTSLIYAPAFYAKTDELIALTQAAAESGGGYISHMRSEGNRLMEGLEELITIGKTAGVHAEVYHMKAAGQANWPKFTQMLDRIEQAQRDGVSVSGNMYTYTAGATGLDAAMPPWVQEGGLDKWTERLADPLIRKRVIQEMRTPSNEWENLLLGVGSPDRVLLLSFKSPMLKKYTGKTLAEVAKLRGVSAEEAAIQLVIEDHTRVGAAYFLMSEDNVKVGLSRPWVALGSDAGSPAAEGVFLKSNDHPRAYGNFARFLGHYVRGEKVAPLGDAIRRITALPAQNFKLKDRGCLKPGCYADVTVFDPATIADHATFDKPAQYATGVRDVFVNGVQVLKDGEHTNARPGRVVRGPGYTGT